MTRNISMDKGGVFTLGIRCATPDDAHAVAEIHVNSWRAAYASILPKEFLDALSVERRTAMWRHIMTEGKSELLVAQRGGEVEGWINFGASRDEGAGSTDAEIWALYVSPTAWSTGMGRALGLAAQTRLQEQGFTSCSLWVLPQNARAIRFYQAAGFVANEAPHKTFVIADQPFEEVRYVCPVGVFAQSTKPLRP